MTVRRSVDDDPFRALFEQAAVGIAVVAADGTSEVNPALARMLGYSQAELAMRGWEPVTHPDDLAMEREHVARIVQGETNATHFEKRYVHRDGRTVWGALTVSAVRHADGRLSHVVALVEDITARKAAEDALRARDEQLRNVIEQSPYSIQTYTLEGHIASANAAWARLFGVTLEEVRDYNVLRDPQLAALGVLPIVERAFRGETVTLPPTPWVPDRGDRRGMRLWVQGTFYPIRSGSGALLQVALLHLDITAQREAEAELERERSFLRAVLDQMPSGVIIADPQGRLLIQNRRVPEIWGMRATPQSQGVGEYGAWEGYHADGRRVLAEEWPLSIALLTSETVPSMDIRIRRGDGTDAWVRCRAAPIRAEDGTLLGGVVIFDDVTREITAGRDLASARVELARSEKFAALGTLVGGVAHELRTPLTYLSNNLYLVETAAKALLADPQGEAARKARERLGSHLTEAHESVERIDRIVEDLRRYTREKPAKPAPGHLDQMVADAVDLFRATHKGEIEVRADLAPTTSVLADTVQIQQLVLNLLQNAYEAKPRGALIRVITKDAPEGPQLVVEDEAGGIPPEVLARMWEPLFTTKVQGSGLGLAIVRRIADHHGARIDADTRPGHGSTFTVTFRRAPPA